MNKQGLFVTIEGIDGCGKSTLIAALKQQALHENIPTLFTKEPGGSSLGKYLRELLNHQTIPLQAKTEFLLFAADRVQHFQEIILPTLAQGTMVISDRCADSSLAYQGYGLGVDKTMIKEVNAWAMNNKRPDVVLYLKLSPEAALERIKKHRETLTTVEMRDLTFWHKVYAGYEEMYANHPSVITIDATQEAHVVAAQAWQGLKAHL